MKERAWPAVLREDLAEAIFARDMKVLRPIEAAPDLDGSDDELRALQRRLQLCCGADIGAAAELVDQSSGVAADVRQIVRDNVHETQLDPPSCERFAEQDVANGFRAEGAAAGTKERNNERLHCNLLRCRCFRFASALLAGRSALHWDVGAAR